MVQNLPRKWTLGSGYKALNGIQITFVASSQAFQLYNCNFHHPSVWHGSVYQTLLARPSSYIIATSTSCQSDMVIAHFSRKPCTVYWIQEASVNKIRNLATGGSLRHVSNHKSVKAWMWTVKESDIFWMWRQFECKIVKSVLQHMFQ